MKIKNILLFAVILLIGRHNAITGKGSCPWTLHQGNIASKDFTANNYAECVNYNGTFVSGGNTYQMVANRDVFIKSCQTYCTDSPTKVAVSRTIASARVLGAYFGKFSDVTGNANIKNGAKVSNDALGGDPASGNSKILVVVSSDSSVKAFPEGQNVTLCNGCTVKGAYYGALAPVTDLTKINSSNIASNLLVANDPIWGVVKKLVIAYVDATRTLKIQIVNEGDMIPSALN